MKVIREVRHQKEGNAAKRGYTVGDAQRRGRRIGGGSGVSLRQNAVSAVISSPTTVGLSCGQIKRREYGPAHGDQAKGIPLRHLHDAVRADIDVLS